MTSERPGRVAEEDDVATPSAGPAGPAASRSGRMGVIPLLAAVTVILVTCLLGAWQISRGQEKNARAERLRALAQQAPIEVTARPLDDDVTEHRLTVTGRFDRAHVVLLENRPHVQGDVSRAGFLVMTPFIPEHAGNEPASQRRAVLVLRGWLPRDAQDRTRIAPFSTPEETVQLAGVALRGAPRVYSLGDPAAEAGHPIRQNIDASAFASEIGMALQPFVIEQHSDTGDGLLRAWPQADQGADRHYGYAFQWFGIAGLSLVWAVILAWRRRR